MMFFNIPMKGKNQNGEIITHSSISGNVQVYRQKDKDFLAFLNLVVPFMKLETGLNELIYEYF